MLGVVLLLAGKVRAADTPLESPQLQKCLQRADDLPDIAAAEAEVWIKKDGGNDAHLCHAFAQSNRGMHVDAAREFWFIASYFNKRDTRRAVLMHNMAGQEFLRGKDIKNAEAQYNASLKLMPDNPDGLVGHAQTRMAYEKYWDALDDLNRALKIKPDDAEALRQRGLVWVQLGNEAKAAEDFDRAEALAAAPVAQ